MVDNTSPGEQDVQSTVVIDATLRAMHLLLRPQGEKHLKKCVHFENRDVVRFDHQCAEIISGLQTQPREICFRVMGCEFVYVVPKF